MTLLLAAFLAIAEPQTADFTPPAVTQRARPDAPRKFCRSGHPKFAEVTLIFDVTGDGKAVNVRVLQSAPQGYFDKKALEAFAWFQFRPALDHGKPVYFSGMTYKFSLTCKQYWPV